MAAYTTHFVLYLTDADQCAAAQAAYPDGLNMSPAAAATLFSVSVDPAAPAFSESSCIWSMGGGNGTAGLTTSVASVNIPVNFTIDQFGNLVAFAGTPAGTYSWNGFILRRGGVPPVLGEALQTHRWMNGFELAQNGEGESGAIDTQRTRHASRVLGGLGLALRNTIGLLVMPMPTVGTGFPTKQSWERIYVCLRALPTAVESVWVCKGSVEAGSAALVAVNTNGTLALYNKGNQASPGTLVATGGQLVRNQWARLDILVTFKTTGGAGLLVLFLNGVQVASMIGNPAGTIGGAGGLLNTTQNHSTSSVGNDSGIASGMEYDLDDWSNKTMPTLFTGLDWLYGTHIQQRMVSGFGPSQAGWGTGAFQTVDGIPPIGQTDSLSTAIASSIIETTFDYVDQQVGCSGIAFNVFLKTAPTVTETLGYSISGGAYVTYNITSTGGSWGRMNPGNDRTQIIYSAGGNLVPPAVTSISSKYTRDANVDPRAVTAMAATAEYIGFWGAEDGGSQEWPIKQPPHNSPWADTGYGSADFTRPDGVFEIMSSTYVGNGTGQDITLKFPAHWVWIRPTTGGTGGARWFSSALAGHSPLIETPDKGLFIRAYQTNPLAGSTGYKFRVAGSQANVNANGVTYQWVAVSDPSMRFMTNGAYLETSATASFVHPLFDGNFTPTAGFLLRELGTASAASGLYFKGPGSAANGASLMASAESATVCAFGTGSITPKTAINVDASQTAYSLWRKTDSSGISGAVDILTYTGDGTGARNIALALNGTVPRFVLVQPNNGVAFTRDPSHTGSNSNAINTSGSSPSTTAITAVAVDQMTVGAALNAGAVVYSVLALSGGDAAGGTGGDNGGPTVLLPPIPPTDQWDPNSFNGWWTSGVRFTGAATISTYPPVNPRDARDWQKLASFATGNAGFYGGFPAPGCVVDNIFIYAGNDYQVSASQPTIRVFDGITDRNVIQIPDVAGVKTIAIVAMLAVGQKIYVTTLDSGTSSSTWAGRVFEFDPITLTLAQMGTQFTGGEVPYALCWHMNRLFLGTNKGDGSAAKVYFFRPGEDTAWTQDHAISTDSVGGVLSMASYQGLLYVGCNATAAMGTNKILVRDTTGAYTTSFTSSGVGTFRASNGFPSMYVFNDRLYATYWNPDTTAVGLVLRFDGAVWSIVYTGTGNTLRPFIRLFESQKNLFLLGGGSGLSACLLSSLDGSNWTNLTAFLTGSTTTVTALPIIGQIGA